MSERQDFEALALPHLDALYRTALRMTGQSASAEDLVQEAYLKAFRNYHRFEPGTSFKAWVFTILTNSYINEYRRKVRGPLVADLSQVEPAAEDEPLYLSSEEIERIKDSVGDEAKTALDKMPDDYRIIFLLSTIEELSYKEIAATLGIPIGTVMSRLFRARSFLRKELGTYARETGFLPGRSEL